MTHYLKGSCSTAELTGFVDEETRTLDLLIFSQTLYQLSYINLGRYGT